MADNLGYTPGAGATVATDEVAGVHYQLVKLVTGASNEAQPVSEAMPLPVADGNSGNLLLRILQMLMAPLGYDKSLQRQRGTVVVESGTVTTVTTVSTVSTVTTCGVVTSLNNLDGYMTRMQILDTNRTAWAQCVRARIT
jgi:hypothetical protein